MKRIEREESARAATGSLASLLPRPRPREKNLLTPNQVVAYNVIELRKEKGWTQQEAARRLDPWLGKLWSKATFSAVERSIESGRKKFDADEVAALALAFDVPVSRLFIPPIRTDSAPVRRVEVNLGGDGMHPGEFAFAMLRETERHDSPAKLAAEDALRNVVFEYVWAKHARGNEVNLGTIGERQFVQACREILEAIGLVPDNASAQKAKAIIRRQLRKKLARHRPPNQR